jgi:hypothetical protein
MRNTGSQPANAPAATSLAVPLRNERRAKLSALQFSIKASLIKVQFFPGKSLLLVFIVVFVVIVNVVFAMMPSSDYWYR